MTEAIVVGAGPNGLSAAVTLARAGLQVTVIEAEQQIGGGTRSGELTIPSVLFDHCSTTHVMGAASPFLRSLDLQRHGLQWLWPQIDLAHPLDNGDAGLLHRSVHLTAAGLGEDGSSWRQLFAPLAANADHLAKEVMRPLAKPPRHPLTLARFGIHALQPPSLLARRFKTSKARALFGGIAAHLYAPMTTPLGASVGLMITATGHRHGWPVAKGGSRAITDALAATLTEAGGTIETGRRIRSLSELPRVGIVLLDLAPSAAADVIGTALPDHVRRAYRRFQHAPAAFKVDIAVEEGIPWKNDRSREAGTLHLGGTFEEIAHAERAVHSGQMPARPYVLASQQYKADPGRSAGNIHPVSMYAHVPHGYSGDATDAILHQLERFAPGARERIVACTATTPAQLEHSNANNVGGDIVAGPVQSTV